MIRLLLFILLPFLFSKSAPNNAERFKPIGQAFKLNWKAEIGSASFRTNVAFTDESLIIGSNGNSFKDISLNDKGAGVYIINRRNGKIKNAIGTKILGDMDVNGVLVYDSKIYYGNDNEEFICSGFDGKILWRLPASADVEHEPFLINNKGRKMIVYATEAGEAVAVDPLTGKKIWTYLTPDFNGWKPTDNRMLFKVKAYFYSGNRFFTRPEVFDVNYDGVDDLIYSDYNLTAVNGKTGKLLWRRELNTDSFSISIMTVQKQLKKNQFSYVQYNRIGGYDTDYSLVTLDSEGRFLSKKHLFQNKNYPATILNKMISNRDESIFALEDSIYIINNSGNVKAVNYALRYKVKKSYNQDSTIETRNYRESLVANKEFVYKGNQRCIFVLSQHDDINWRNAFISIVSLETGEIIESFELPSYSEMPPLIKDINNDGKQDLLINCMDGKLYCYTLTNLIFQK